MDFSNLLDEWMKGGVTPPIAQTLGIRLLSAGDGVAVGELTVRPELFNAMGSLHGGVFADLADAIIGAALATRCGTDELFTTTQLSLSYFAAVRGGHLRARATMLHRGRTTGHIECDLLDENDERVAKASSTCLFFQPR